MKRHFFTLIIIVCSVLLTGCNNNMGKENAEATEQQMSANLVSEDDISDTKEPEPTTEKEVTDYKYQDYKWQEMPDLKVDYIPELGYHRCVQMGTCYSGAIICWKDMLSIGNAVYRRENEIYKRTDESLQEWFNISDNFDFGNYYQWNNLLIFESDGVILDMDSGQLWTYPLDDWVYCAFQGKIYYRQNEGILCMDLLSGEVETIYDEAYVGYFMIRDNGDMIISVINEIDSKKVWEFWLLSYDAKGDIKCKKIWEVDNIEYKRYKYIEMMEFNDRGLFLLLEYYRTGGGIGTDFICLSDNGEREEIMLEEGWTFWGQIIVDDGYFRWDSQMLSEEEKVEILGNDSFSSDLVKKATTVVDSISYYDFQGNKLETWQLIEDEMLEAGYHLVDIVYGNGEILAFYENEELDDLYISKVQPWKAEGD